MAPIVVQEELELELEDTEELPKKKAKAGAKRSGNRPVIQRAPLSTLLQQARYDWHCVDPLAFVRPPTAIISDEAIVILARAGVYTISTATHVRTLLKETEEWESLWALKVASVIVQYDCSIPQKRGHKAATVESMGPVLKKLNLGT